MDKKELLQELMDLSKTTPQKTQHVFQLCLELYRWQKRVPELAVSDGAEAENVLLQVRKLRKKLIELVEPSSRCD